MSDDTILRIEREFKASPEAVYDAWVNPEFLVKWWGPEGVNTPIHQLDVRAGGAWSTTMENAEGQRFTSSGIYKVLDRPNRLVLTWGWDLEDGSRSHETEIELSFSKTAIGTLMVLVQGRFENKDARDEHNTGWCSSFNDLERELG